MLSRPSLLKILENSLSRTVACSQAATQSPLPAQVVDPAIRGMGNRVS